jgi:hypothetical protein
MVRKTTSPDGSRVEKAIKEAKTRLGPLATARSWSIIGWHDPDSVRDPKAEFYSAVGFIDALLNPDPEKDKEGRQVADDFLGVCAQLVREAILPALRRGLPPRQKRDQRPKQQFLFRDRWIAAVVEGICNQYGFNPTRNDATEEECGCSIVAGVLRRLGIKLSESQVATIWRKNRQ